MTTEQAIKILNGAIKKPNTIDGYLGQALTMAINALKNQPEKESIEDEVWELARRIICPSDCCEDSISAHTKEIFNKEGWEIRGIFNDLSYQEAKAKYEAWLSQKDKIHYGDEIISLNDDVKAVMLDCADYESIYVMTENGCVERWKDLDGVKKTGRHFPEIAEMLKKMRGEEE